MNYGFMVTILKLNNNLHSGSIQTSHGRKKHVKVGAMASQCWLFFANVRVLYTTNLLQEVRRSTKNIALKFWKDCVMPWEENDHVSGQVVTGFFTTITHQRTHRTLCSNFWRNTRLYSLDIAPCDFWMFSKLKMVLKGNQFDDIETIKSNATRELKARVKMCVRGLLQDVEAPLGACGSIKWGRLRRMPRSGWRRIAPCGDMNAGRILFGNTSYIGI